VQPEYFARFTLITSSPFALICDRNFTEHFSTATNNAVTVTIPNEQLMFDEPYTTSNGWIKVDPRFKNVSVVGYSDPKNYTVPRTGAMIFSSTCLMANHDKDKFTITQVQGKPTTPTFMGIDTVNNCAGVVTLSSDAAMTFKTLSSGAKS
jgi:IMP cyclohydrolase